MKSVSRLAVVGLFAFTAAALAEESTAQSEIRHLIARADASDVRGAIQSVPFDYVGRYESANGDIVVFMEGDALMIELPESSALPPTRLHAVDPIVFTTDTDMRVTFRADASGHIEGLVALAADGQMSVSAVKTPSRRGFVTIHDIEPTAAPSRRGFVTIHDIDPATVQMRAAVF
jgi:Domain of unknown function (DUF3471)